MAGVHLFAFSCIIGGGIGNIFDRIKFNSVTDFMCIELGPFRTGIFNMADVSVTFGVVLLLISTFIIGKTQVLKL